MEKKITNVVKILKIVAESHKGCVLTINDEELFDIQVSFNSTSIPLVSDVRGVLECFFTNVNQIMHVDNGWGFTEIYLSDGEFIEGDVDTKELKLCIPYAKGIEIDKLN